MKKFIYYEKGYDQPLKDDVLSGLFTYQDTNNQDAGYPRYLNLEERRLLWRK